MLDTTAGSSPGAPAAHLAFDSTVSVLVRSMGRPTLNDALASVAAQTEAPLEVVVLNASGRAHPPLPAHCGSARLRLVNPGQPLDRAAAANAAMQAASGHWLMFLDDDDTLQPPHLQRLLAALRSQPGARVAHTGVQMVDPQGQVQSVLDEPVDLLQLWAANRMAIHAVMFARSLVTEGAHFDETLPIYEDWDFWFQLARRERFVHVAGVSASYRLLGNSGASDDIHEALRHRQRQAFYRKWLPQLDSDTLEALAASAEHARGDHREALRLLARAQQALAGERDAMTAAQAQYKRDLQTAQAAAAALRTTLDTERDQARQREEQLRHDLEHTQGELHQVQADRHRLQDSVQNLQTYVASLEHQLRDVLGSLSWRLGHPLRVARRTASRPGLVAVARRAWRALPLQPDTRLALRDALLRRGWGRSLARQVAPHTVPAAAPPALPAAKPGDKERVRADAEAALTEFLAGTQRIVLGPPAAAPLVSVIVVLFNQAGLSRLCLQSLAASEGVDFEALVVDNGSSDRVPQLLERVDGATLIRPGENLGFLLAVNRAAEQARGRYLVLLNNDAMLEPHTLRNAVARLQADAGAGAVGGPILLWDGRLQEAGSIVWRDGSCLGYGRGDDPERPDYRFVRDVDYCSGAFLMIRRALFEQLGRLDTAFVPAYYEESDFCVRLWEAGHRIVYDPAVRIRHFEFASEVASGWAIELQARHRLLFVERHPAFLAERPLPDVAAIIRARARLRPGAQRVLVIDDRVPLPWLGQGYPRAADLVRTLAEAGHGVTHYPLQFPNEDWADVRRALPETVEVMLGLGNPGLHGFLQQRQGGFDAVIVSRPHNMKALRELLRRQPDLLQGARLVYDAEAMFTLRDVARAALDGKPLQAAEQQRRIADELALADGAQAILAVSEPEAAHYRDAGYASVQVLGHTLDVVDGTPGFDARADFLFVGALTDDDTPNSDSMRWFVGEVWPRVQAALGPQVCVHLVGSCEAPSIRALAGPTVRVHGRVDALDRQLDRARVFVVPTRYAAGIPHKAHEAAARGLPMVTTPLIAGQLGWHDIVAVGDGAEAFAQACVALYQDAARWQRQRQALLQAVARDCSHQAFLQALNGVLGVGPQRP